MINSNLLQLISKLNAPEFKEFGEFIRSSFFNKNESVIKLYDYTKIYYPDFSEMNFEKKFVYENLFPNIEYDDAFMRKLMFNLAKLAEDYLVYKNINSKNFLYSRILIDELIKKDLKKGYTKKLKSLEEELKDQKIQDVEYFRNKLQIDGFYEIIMMRDRVVVNSKDKHEEYLINYSNSLINYFLTAVLEEYRLLATYKNIIKFDFVPELYKLILEYLKKNKDAHNVPLISVYYNTLLLILNRNATHFEKLKKIAMNELNTLSFSDKYSTFATLVNFANDEYLKGDKKYLKEAFELYKIILENKLYAAIEGEPFYNPLFRNIVKVGLLMKEVEWTENFINSYIGKLIPEARESSLYLSNARVNFVKGNYDKSLEELSKIVSIHHFQVKPSIKSLSLMIYIEKGWFDQAVDLIDAYRHFVSYEKLFTDVSKEKNNNFIKFCNEIIKLNSKFSGEKINNVKFDLRNTENILEKEWLTGKFEELEKTK